MKQLMIIGAVLALAVPAMADTFGTGANQFTIDFVPISGDAGDLGSWSAGHNYTFSGVNSGDYRIGKFEITNDQWTKFVNEHGKPDGSPSNAYDADPYWTGSSVPTNNVSWYEAAQFVNWLNVQAGKTEAYKFTGTPGTSDYTFGIWNASEAWGGTNLYRHKDAYYFLPTEDEWLKAAYWNGTTLQTYSNASDGDLISGSPDPSKWNYSPSVGSEPWNVGSGVQELNGTYDMMGNVWEWNETQIGSFLGVRGGTYNFNDGLRVAYRNYQYPYLEHTGIGFRVASVPEPTSLVLLGLGGLALRYRKR